jgi:hypothetical protein
MMDAHCEELHVMALSLSDSKAGSTDYLKCYRKALKIVVEGFTDETKAKYHVLAKRWTEDKPPPRQQRWYVHSHQLHTGGD